MGPIDRTVLEGADIRAALTARDIGAVYRHLRRLGLSQRHLGRLTGQSQSEVSEILRGRQVCNVWLLERIADGLGIPRAWLGVDYGEKKPEKEPPTQEEVGEDVKRRVLVATATMVVVGQALGLGEPVELALPTDQVLPSRLGMSDVHIVRAVTDQLRGLTRYYGGQADMFGAAVRVYTPWLQVPALETVKAQLYATLAELHTEAGWACYDSGLDGTGYFTRALRLAGKAGDTYGVANAAWQAGLTWVRIGHPNYALKLFQLGQLQLGGFSLGRTTPVVRAEDPRLPTLKARLDRQCATSWALMKAPEEATRCLAEAHDGWEPCDDWERAGGIL